MTAADQARPTGEVVSVNLAHLRDNPSRSVHGAVDSKPAKTGIDKRPVAGPVAVRWLGLDGDSICDTANHGGRDQAVYAYAEQDAEWWQAELAGELSFQLGPGSFGENLTLRGVDLSGAVIGERWRVGGMILQVSLPRIPCSVLAGYWGVNQLVKRFTAANRPGAYLRVLAEGELQAGDSVTVLDRPAHGLTIRETMSALSGDRSLTAKLLTAPELPEAVHELARTWLAKAAVR